MRLLTWLLQKDVIVPVFEHYYLCIPSPTAAATGGFPCARARARACVCVCVCVHARACVCVLCAKTIYIARRRDGIGRRRCPPDSYRV